MHQTVPIGARAELVKSLGHQKKVTSLKINQCENKYYLITMLDTQIIIGIIFLSYTSISKDTFMKHIQND